MLYTLYDQSKTYIFPNGEEANFERVKQDFPLAGTVDYVVRGDNNVMTEMTQLSVMRQVYCIDEEVSAEDAVALVNQKEAARREATLDLPDYTDMTLENQQAIGELGVSTAALLESNSQLASSDADVLQAIGELGAMVAAMQVSPDTPSNAVGETA